MLVSVSAALLDCNVRRIESSNAVGDIKAEDGREGIPVSTGTELLKPTHSD